MANSGWLFSTLPLTPSRQREGGLKTSQRRGFSVGPKPRETTLQERDKRETRN